MGPNSFRRGSSTLVQSRRRLCTASGEGVLSTWYRRAVAERVISSRGKWGVSRSRAPLVGLCVFMVMGVLVGGWGGFSWQLGSWGGEWLAGIGERLEERRVGKEGRFRGSPD